MAGNLTASPVIIKLYTGEQLIAYTVMPTDAMSEKDIQTFKFDQYLYLFHPARMSMEKEKLMLDDWIPMASDFYFPIQHKNVIIVVKPSNDAINFYFEWAKQTGLGTFKDMLANIQRFFTPEIKNDIEPELDTEVKVKPGDVTFKAAGEEYTIEQTRNLLEKMKPGPSKH